MLTCKALAEVVTQGIQFKIPRWIRDRKTHPAMLILADSQLINWPGRDCICRVEVRKWPLKRWTQAVRLGEIRISSTTVILYLESSRNWVDVPPIKNALQTLCKTIRNNSNCNDPRIFIANHLPRVSSSPVQQSVPHSNFTLQQAVRSICRSIGKVYELSIYEHFISSKGKMIRPSHKYFADQDNLIPFGCLVFRECVLRETGVKGYWF